MYNEKSFFLSLNIVLFYQGKCNKKYCVSNRTLWLQRFCALILCLMFAFGFIVVADCNVTDNNNDIKGQYLYTTIIKRRNA